MTSFINKTKIVDVVLTSLYFLQSYFDTYTLYLNQIFVYTWFLIVDNKDKAVLAAQKLLQKYDSILPKIAPYMGKETMWETRLTT